MSNDFLEYKNKLQKLKMNNLALPNHTIVEKVYLNVQFNFVDENFIQDYDLQSLVKYEDWLKEQ